MRIEIHLLAPGAQVERGTRGVAALLLVDGDRVRLHRGASARPRQPADRGTLRRELAHLAAELDAVARLEAYGRTLRLLEGAVRNGRAAYFHIYLTSPARTSAGTSTPRTSARKRFAPTKRSRPPSAASPVPRRCSYRSAPSKSCAAPTRTTSPTRPCSSPNSRRRYGKKRVPRKHRAAHRLDQHCACDNGQCGRAQQRGRGEKFRDPEPSVVVARTSDP